MRRVIVLVLLCACSAFAATVRLYLKDGTYQLVREYKVEGDRLRYYTVERGDWEEIPLELVDLKRTEGEVKVRQESMKEEAAALAAEEKAERAARAEVAKVPVEPGAYLAEAGQLKPYPRRDGDGNGQEAPHPAGGVTDSCRIGQGGGRGEGRAVEKRRLLNLPEFYVRLAKEERFGIMRLKVEKGSRIVERISVVPVTKEIIEEQDQVEVFRRQLGDGLYRSGR